MTLNEVWPSYLEHKLVYVRPATVATYCSTWRMIRDFFGPMDVNDIHTKAVEKWCMGQLSKLSKNSIRDRLTLVNNMIDYAAYEFDVPVTRIQVRHIRWPQSTSTQSTSTASETYSPAEIKRIVTYAAQNPTPTNVLVSVMIATGIRIGEACALTFDDVDVESHSIRVSKTVERLCHFRDESILSQDNLEAYNVEVLSKAGSTALIIGTPKSRSGYRSIPLPKELFKFLKGMKALLPGHYYIGTQRDKPIEPRGLRGQYRDLVLNKVGLDRCLKPHAMRHTFATMLLTAGTDVRTVSELLGHSDATTTLTVYCHATDESKRKAVSSSIGKQFALPAGERKTNKRKSKQNP